MRGTTEYLLGDVGVTQHVLELDRHIALEPRQLSHYSEGAEAGEDLALQIPLRLHPGARQGPRDVVSIFVLASTPSQKGRPIEPAADL